MRKKLAKFILLLFVTYQVLNPISFLGSFVTYAADYGTITDSVTITEDSTAEYVLLTWENQSVVVSGATLDVTGYVDGYVGYTDYPVISWAIVLDGSGDKFVFENWTWNLNGNGVIVSGSNNEFNVSNSQAYYPIFLYWNNNKFVSNNGLKFQELFVRWTGHSIEISWGFAPMITLNEYASAEISLNNLSLKDNYNHDYYSIVRLQTGSKLDLTYIWVDNLDIHLYTGNLVKIDGENVMSYSIPCEHVYNGWCFDDSYIFIRNGKILQWENIQLITWAGNYDISLDENKYNYVVSSYTWSDAIVKIDTTVFGTWNIFGGIRLTGLNAVEVKSIDLVRLSSNHVWIWELDIEHWWKLQKTDIFAPDIELWNDPVFKLSWDINLYANNLNIINRDNSYINSINVLDKNYVTLGFNGNVWLWVTSINRFIEYVNNSEIDVYSGFDTNWDLLFTWEWNTIYYCNNEFTFNQDDCLPPTPLFYGSWNFSLTEFTGNNHKLVVTDIRPELLKIGEIKANEGDLLTGFNLLIISWSDGEEYKLLTGNWNFSGYTTLPIYVKIWNVTDIPSPAIVYDVASQTGDMKFISHNVGPFVWGTKQDLGIQAVVTKIPVVDNHGKDLTINYDVFVSKTLHDEQFVNNYTTFSSGEQLSSVTSGYISYKLPHEFIRSINGSSFAHIVDWWTNIWELFDTGAVLISWNVVKLDTDVPSNCFASLWNNSLLCALLNEYENKTLFAPYFTGLAEVYIQTGNYIYGEEQLNYLNSDGSISSSKVIVPVQDIVEWKYGYASITGVDTSSYLKSDVNIQITTDADDSSDVIDAVKNGVAINVATWDLFQTYLPEGYTGAFEVFNGNGLLLAPLYSWVCPDGFEKWNWLPLSGTGAYCLKPVVVTGDSSFEIHYTTKVYYPVYLHVDEDQVGPITGLYYEFVTSKWVLTGYTTDNGDTLIWNIQNWTKILGINLSWEKLANYNYFVTYFGDYENNTGYLITGVNVELPNTTQLLVLNINKIVDTTGSIDVLLKSTNITWTILVNWTGDDRIYQVGADSLNGYVTWEVESGNYQINYKFKDTNPTIDIYFTGDFIPGETVEDKIAYVKNIWGYELSGNVIKNIPLTPVMKFAYDPLFRLNISGLSDYTLTWFNVKFDNNYFIVWDESTHWNVEVNFASWTINDYICWNWWNSYTGDNNNLICVRDFDNVWLFEKVDLNIIKKSNTYTFNLNYGSTTNPVYFALELSGVNNPNIYTGAGIGTVSLVAIQTGDYIVKLSVNSEKVPDVYYYAELGNYYSWWNVVGTTEVEFTKQITFDGTTSDSLLIPKRIIVSGNITWNVFDDTTSVKLYLPSEVNVITGAQNNENIGLDFNKWIFYTTNVSSLWYGKVVVEKTWIDCDNQSGWFVNSDGYCEYDFDMWLYEEHPYRSINLNVNTYSLTLSWTIDEKCWDYISASLRYDPIDYYMRKWASISWNNYSLVFNIPQTGDYELTIYAGKCWRISKLVTVNSANLIENIDITAGKWIKVTWRENTLTGNVNNNIYVELYTGDNWDLSRRSDNSGYIVKIPDNVNYNFVVRDRFNWSEKTLLGIFSGDTRLDTTTTWVVNSSDLTTGSTITLVFKEGYTLVGSANVDGRVDIYTSWTNEYVAGGRIQNASFVIMWLPEWEYKYQAWTRNWKYENTSGNLTINGDSTLNISFPAANTSIDMSFDKSYVIPGKDIRLKISPNANDSGTLALSGSQVSSWDYYVYSGENIVDSGFNLTDTSKNFTDIANRTITVKLHTSQNIAGDLFKVSFAWVDLQVPVEKLQVQVLQTAKPNQAISVYIKAPKNDNISIKLNGETYTGFVIENGIAYVPVVFENEGTWTVQVIDSTNNIVSDIYPVIVKSDIPVLTSYSIKVNWIDRVSDDNSDNVIKAKYFNVWANHELVVKDSIKVDTIFENAPDFVEYYIDNIKASNWEFTAHTIEGYGIKDLVVKYTKNGKTYSQVIWKVVILIDPSGKVYDKIKWTAIPNIKASLYQLVDKNWDVVTSLTWLNTSKLADYLDNGYTSWELLNTLDVCKAGGEAYPCSWKLWDGADSEQVNPQYTDESGYYGWDVPEGYYFVKFEDIDWTTNGEYSPWESYVTHVPPAVTDLNQYVVEKSFENIVDKNSEIITWDVDITTWTALSSDKIIKDTTAKILIKLPSWLTWDKAVKIEKVQIPSIADEINISSDKKLVKKLAIDVVTDYTGSVNFNTWIQICAKTTLTSTNWLVIYYTIDGTTWTKDDYATSTETISNGLFCFYTKHFTTFVVGEEQNNSSGSNWSSNSGWSSSVWSSNSGSSWGSSRGSSYHSWWGGWGWGWYLYNTSSTTSNKTTKSIKKSIIKTVTTQAVNKKLSSIKFKTKKFQVASKLLNKLAVNVVITSKLLLWEKFAKKIFEEYYEVLKWLKQLEDKKITKSILKKKVKIFLKDYIKYQKEFKKVVKEEKISMKGENVKLYKVSYKSNKLSNIVNNVLDKLIVKELNKAKYTKEDVKKCIDAYNKFKLAVRYMKEIDKTEGKKLAKEYAKKMIEVLNK